MEEWRPVIGYESHYEVSSFGRVRRIARAKGAQLRVIVPWPDGCGRLRVYLCRDNVRRVKVIARLVAAAFLGESVLEVNHIDGDFTNNKLTNLEYTTRKENAVHASRMGLLAHGERIPWSKLTERDVIEMRILNKTEGLGQRRLARRYGVSTRTIWCALTNRTWRHI